MITNSKVPQIRFKGFSGEWETKELGDIGSVAMNKRIFKSQTTEKGDIPFYKIGTFGGKADAFISKQLFEDYKSKYPYPKQGDLLISASGSIGRIVEYTGKDEYFQDSNIVWLKHENQLENSFLKQFYNIVKWSGLEGSTIQRLYNKNILETLISFPKQRNEQAKIGDYFQQLDKLIEYQEKKHQKLKQFKKAMLSKMFPKNGADTPEIRFRGFSRNWKFGIVSDLLIERNIQTPKSEQYPLMAFVAYKGVTHKGDRFNREFLVNDEENKKYKQTELGDFIYSSNNLETGSIGLNNYGSATISPVYSIFQTTELGFSNFINCLLVRKHFINQMIKWRQGVVYGQWRIHESDFLKIEVKFPTIEEQIKIGNYFQKLDNQIELQQKELEKLKNIKKASLAKMFV